MAGVRCSFLMTLVLSSLSLSSATCPSGYSGSNCLQTNVALSKPAQQSSMHSSDFPASRAVDGSNGDESTQCTHTLGQAYPWWRVDLLAIYAIYSVSVLNRKDCCGNRLHDFSIRITNTSSPYAVYQQCGLHAGAVGGGETKNIVCDSGPLYGRYVYIQIQTGPSTEILTLCEVEVNGVFVAEQSEMVPNKDCKMDTLGKAYMGKVRTTRNNIPCQRWDTTSPHTHSTTASKLPDATLPSAADYCRNPDDSPGGPWCYTTRHNKPRWAYCDVPRCPTNNIALSKPTTQSSTRPEGGASSRAVDGNKATNFNSGNSCTHTLTESNPWWRVDLQYVYAVSSISVTNRNLYFKSLSDFEIRVTNVPSIASTDPLCSHHQGVVGSGETKEIPCTNVVFGRYLYIQILRVDVLVLCEVEVRGLLVSDNIALSKPTAQSSTAHGGVSSHAVDGNKATAFSSGSCTHTKDDNNPWWRVDLQAVYAVSSVTVTNRNVIYNSNFYIRVTNVPSTSSADPLCSHHQGVIGSGETKEIPCTNVVFGRYLYIQILGINAVVLCEVEVRGLLVSAKFNQWWRPIQNSVVSHTEVTITIKPWTFGVESVLTISHFTVQYKAETAITWSQAGADIPSSTAVAVSRVASGLSPGTNYLFSGQIVYSDGSSQLGSITRLTIPCTAPSRIGNLVLTTERQGSSLKSKITATWDAPASANCDSITEYQVLSKKTGASSWDSSSSTTSNTYTITNLEAYVEYDIGVTAVNNDNKQSVVKYKSITTAQTVPETVTNLAATALSSTSVQVTWSPPAKANGIITKYIVQQKLSKYVACPNTLNNNYQPIPEITDVSKRQADVTGLEPYAAYSFRVWAHTSVGADLFKEVTVSTLSQAPSSSPSVPSFSPQDITATRVIATWSYGCMHHNGPNGKYYYTVNNGPRNEVSGTSATITGLTPYTDYSVKVQFCTAKGCSSGSAGTVKTKESIPGTVTNLSVRPLSSTRVQVSWSPPAKPNAPGTVTSLTVSPLSSTSVQVSWSAPTSRNGVIIKYAVERKIIKYVACSITHSNNYAEVRVITDLNTDITGLVPYTEYSVQVRAYTSVGPGLFEEETVTTMSQVPTHTINLPTITSVQATHFIVAWTAIPCDQQRGPFKDYTINVIDVDRTNGTSKELTSTGTAVTVNDLDPYTVYSVTVKVCNTEGCGGYGTATQQRTDESVPSEPTAVSYTSINETALQVNWSLPLKPNGILTGYVVKLKPVNDNSTNITVQETGSDVFEATFFHLKPFTVYDIQVVAKTSKGEGEVVTIKGSTSEGKPGPPHGFMNTSRTATTLSFKWMEPVNPRGVIKGYKISCKALIPSNKNTRGTIVSPELSADLSGSVSNLESATQYNCTVTGRTSVGYGEESNSVLTWTAPPDLSSVTLTPPKVDEEAATDTTVTLKLSPGVLPDGLTPSEYLVVVEELKSRRRRRDVFLSAPNQTLSNYNDAKQNGLGYYVTALLTPDDLKNGGIDFVVGDGKVYGGFTNPPLEKSKSYRIYFGMSTSIDGVSSTKYVTVGGKPILVTQYVPPAPSPIGGIIGGVVGGLVVIVIIVVVVVILRRRRKPKPSASHKKLEVKYTTQSSNGGQIEQDNIDNIVNEEEEHACIEIERPLETSDDNDLYGNVGSTGGRMKTSDFLDYVMAKKKHGKDGYRDEYNSLPDGLVLPHTEGANPDNKTKNRYANIIPYDVNRVVLEMRPGDPTSHYINADYVDSYSTPKYYIATQGPNTATIIDFIQMVWQTNSNRIVMLTNCVEVGRKKCEQYWPKLGEAAVHDDITVTLLDQEIFPEYTVRMLSFVKDDGVSRLVKQFHFTKWPDHGVPKAATSILNFRRKVHMQDGTSEGYLIVHCSAGVGRTGTYIGLDYLLAQHRAEDMVDVFGCVDFLRRQRPKMVQTLDQYSFLHNALAEAIRCGETAMPCSVAAVKISASMKRNPMTGKSTVESQYELLRKIETLEAEEKDDDPAGLLEDNIDKNRDRSIIPKNISRPILMTSVKGRSNYINASFVDGYQSKEGFVITQMPLPDTIVDFWRMIYDHDISAIVMLNELDEKDQTCLPYWPKKQETFDVFRTDLVSEYKESCMTIRQIKLQYLNRPKEEPKVIRQFQLTSWPKSDKLPKDSYDMISLMDEVHKWQQKSETNRVAVHCMNGATRSGMYLATVAVCEKIQLEQEVDVFQAVKQVRQFRPQCVNTLDQYKFIYTTAVRYMETFETYSNFR